MDAVGKQVQAARENAEWSRARLALYLDISPPALYRKEIGQEKFTPDQLDTISHVFGVEFNLPDRAELGQAIRRDYGVPGVKGIRGLLLSILVQRVRDSRSQNPKVRSEALDWMMHDDMCAEICEEFGYSVSALHRAVGIPVSTKDLALRSPQPATKS